MPKLDRTDLSPHSAKQQKMPALPSQRTNKVIAHAAVISVYENVNENVNENEDAFLPTPSTYTTVG